MTVCLLGTTLAMVNERKNRPPADRMAAAGGDPDAPGRGSEGKSSPDKDAFAS